MGDMWWVDWDAIWGKFWSSPVQSTPYSEKVSWHAHLLPLAGERVDQLESGRLGKAARGKLRLQGKWYPLNPLKNRLQLPSSFPRRPGPPLRITHNSYALVHLSPPCKDKKVAWAVGVSRLRWCATTWRLRRTDDQSVGAMRWWAIETFVPILNSIYAPNALM